MAHLIDGRAAAAALRAQVQQEVARFRHAHDSVPGLATVLVGDKAAPAT